MPSRCASLPVALPIPTDRCGERPTDQPICQPTVIFQTGGMGRIGTEMPAIHLQMLPTDHAPEPREVAFCKIGVNPIQAVGLSAAITSRSLCTSTNAVLCCTLRSRESWTADNPLEAFTTRQIAPSRSTNDNLREAKMVPEVTLNWPLSADCFAIACRAADDKRRTCNDVECSDHRRRCSRRPDRSACSKWRQRSTHGSIDHADLEIIASTNGWAMPRTPRYFVQKEARSHSPSQPPQSRAAWNIRPSAMSKRPMPRLSRSAKTIGS